MDPSRKNADNILQDFENFIQKHPYGQSPSELYEPISYIMNLGGKRIRPLLTLMAYSLYRDDYGAILGPAAAVEVFHNFTLMHDDIMDNAPLRRGQATVHEKWNHNVAILSGDVMLVKAYDLLLGVENDLFPIVVRQFNKVAAEVCEGQQHDMNFESRDHVSEAEYIDMIRQKTAVLLGFSLWLGAILARASEDDAQKMYEFGVNIGIGFQLKDDLLDVYADQAKFGKQVGGDIISNKKTFLLIKARELAQHPSKELLGNWIKSQAFDRSEKVREVKKIYDELGIKALTETKMQEYFKKGFDGFSQLEVPNQKMKQLLYRLTLDLANREK